MVLPAGGGGGHNRYLQCGRAEGCKASRGQVGERTQGSSLGRAKRLGGSMYVRDILLSPEGGKELDITEDGATAVVFAYKDESYINCAAQRSI